MIFLPERWHFWQYFDHLSPPMIIFWRLKKIFFFDHFSNVENLFRKYFSKIKKNLKLTKCHLLAQSVTFMTPRWHFFLDKCHPLKKYFNWKFDFFTQKVTLLAICRSPQSLYDFLNVEKNIFLWLIECWIFFTGFLFWKYFSKIIGGLRWSKYCQKFEKNCNFFKYTIFFQKSNFIWNWQSVTF